ncbi:MAG: hypothetical protein AB1405_01335 [Bdellovibrionota bacterium]
MNTEYFFERAREGVAEMAESVQQAVDRIADLSLSAIDSMEVELVRTGTRIATAEKGVLETFSEASGRARAFAAQAEDFLKNFDIFKRFQGVIEKEAA